MAENVADFSAILEVLARHEVEFIVVGGVCAVLLGAPVATFDLDIVHSRTEQNLDRFSKALEELDAHYRDHLPRHIRPARVALAQSGDHLLATRFGPLDVLGSDVLGSIGEDDDYPTLVSKSERVQIGRDVSIRILNLDTLIEVKQKTGRPKDNYMLEILRAMKEDSAE